MGALYLSLRKVLAIIISVMIVTVSFVVLVHSDVETPQVEWSKSYGAVGSLGNSMIHTADGGYVLAGYNSTGYDESIHTYRHKPILIKTNSSGDVQWEKTYEPENLSFHVIIQTDDSGYAIFGYDEITKIDAQGNLQWSTMYTLLPGGSINSNGIQTSDGGYLLVGSTTNSSYTQNTVAWILKTDGNGNMLWNKTFGDLFSPSPTATSAFSAIETGDRGYLVAGHWEGSCWLLKTDESGNFQWNKTYDFRYNGTVGEYKYTSISRSSDGYVLTGFATPIPFVVKVDFQGNMQWNQHYLADGFFKSIVATNDDGFLAVGSFNLVGWMVKTDSSGTLLWDSTYGDSAHSTNVNILNSVVRTGEGGYAVAGTINDSVWLVKFAPDSSKTVSPELLGYVLPLVIGVGIIALVSIIIYRKWLNKRQ